MRRSLSSAVVLSTLGAVLAAPTAAAATCAPTVLPNPPDAMVSAVTGTDGAGTYVGIATDGTERFGVRWRDGQVERLPDNLIPYDMNRAGVIAGSMEVYDEPTSYAVAVLMAPDGTVTNVDGGYSAGVSGINDRGDAVGWMYPEHPIMHLVGLWRAGQEPQYLDDGMYAVRDIDDEGHILGDYAGYDTPRRVWDVDGNVVRQFGPYQPGEVRFDLADIDDGRLAATRVQPDGQTQVFILGLRPGGRDAPLPGSTGGHARAIDNGVVVGSGPQGAMMWRRTGATVLPAPDGTTTFEATVVNGDGTEAAGISVTPDGDKKATVWRCG